MGADGFPDYEAHFEDFYALNAFIRENADNLMRRIQSRPCYVGVYYINNYGVVSFASRASVYTLLANQKFF